MRYAGEAFILPRNYTPSGGIQDNPAIIDVSDADYAGSMWFDGHNKRFSVRFENGDPVGLTTDLGYSLAEERGIQGRLILNEAQKVSDAPESPPERPPGWSTSNMIYYNPTNQIQVFGNDSLWRSLVGSATTGVEFIIDGTTAKLNVIGVGSISLGTLS